MATYEPDQLDCYEHRFSYYEGPDWTAAITDARCYFYTQRGGQQIILVDSQSARRETPEVMICHSDHTINSGGVIKATGAGKRTGKYYLVRGEPDMNDGEPANEQTVELSDLRQKPKNWPHAWP